ncbi:MAG: site-specific integrase [Streptosporangiaceae bacterium]
MSDLLGCSRDLVSWAKESGVRHGQRFLIGPDGFADLRVNAFLGSARMRNLSEATNRDYAYSLALWLNFLHAVGRPPWWQAGVDDAEEFQFWRLADPANDHRVGTSAFAKDLAAGRKFYRWIGNRYPGVCDPFDEMIFPVARREASVKWLDPAAVRRWRDLGLRGRDLSGRADRSWRGRNEERDAAFADGLYGTGLRLTEWGSVVLPELPRLTADRAFFTCALSDACAKGGYGHPYWIPRAAVSAVLGYIEGARARAVRSAQDAGRYDALRGLRLAEQTQRRGLVVIPDGSGGTVTRSWNLIGPAVRRTLFRSTPQGLEPLHLWLNEDGLPRDPHGWHGTFANANARVRQLGLTDFAVTAHMLRHSCALRWFAIGKLASASRLRHLSEEETRDFRAQFGDTWHLVQTILGHRSVETTKNVYLEPFRRLDVELLLVHADGFPVGPFMAEAFASHSMVRSDPLACSR